MRTALRIGLVWGILVSSPLSARAQTCPGLEAEVVAADSGGALAFAIHGGLLCIGATLCDTVAIAIASGTFHLVTLKSDGTVWAWGRNDSGQVGNNSSTGLPETRPVQVLSGVKVISAGNVFSLALKTDGTV